MTQPDTSVSFIGLGNMGNPMASRLVAAGYRVTGFDLAESARDTLAESGGTPATSAADAVAGSDVVILMLPNSSVVEAVLSDESVLSALAAGAIVVDMSSSEPLRSRALAQRLAADGIRFVDAPVSGGVTGARAGSLTIMVGGSTDDAAAVEGVLSALGRPTRVGEVGAGHAAKALNNLLSATHLWATSEAVLAGERFGLDPAVLLGVFNSSSGRSGSTENKWPNFVLTDSYDSGFGLGLMLKDMRIAVDLAEELGAPSVLGRTAVERWQRASDSLGRGADHTEVARWLRQNPLQGGAMD
ncbi:3-hydroxyisobutyrate dehydrogenase [Agreia bicolorata]|uniref:3-hydroxyisobutyrate dehydrogenase n=1 Tax=Agreia bicolorata TaxID=110935 RepID=A0A1T4Y8H4_9MICO|nr:NAD(P)-dependent oxidoreductase [Agreia bicolorata]SKA98117.1 3-hydroxyisobutyrate dehydrogenase [Agreia bicolorata]